MTSKWNLFVAGTVAVVALIPASVAPTSAAADVPESPAGEAPATIIVVRHAEKVDDSRDPTLSEAGFQRAEALAEALVHAGLDAAYASQYQRTRLTAMPAAQAAGLSVRVAPIEGDIDAWAHGFAAELTQNHAGETILVAGHSNTVPPLVAALCDCRVEALTDSDYDRIYLVTDAGGEVPSLITARYGLQSSDAH